MLDLTPPVAVGGVGGSGTRLVAAMLMRMGCFMGQDFNVALDNLWFTLLFKRLNVWEERALQLRSLDVFIKAMKHLPFNSNDMHYLERWRHHRCAEFDEVWASARVDSLVHAGSVSSSNHLFWGWKEPNTHLFLAFLLQNMPGLRYIHVMRHGLDMAFSHNQNQLKMWGNLLLDDDSTDITPVRSLRFWLVVHAHIRSMVANCPQQVLLLNYDDLCASPEYSVEIIESFLGVSLGHACRKDLWGMPQQGKSGRYQQYDISAFGRDDLHQVESFGFSV